MHLLKRIVTAIPLLVMLVWLLLFASDQVFMLASLLLTMAISFEWGVVIGIQKLAWRIVYMLIQGLVLLILYFARIEQVVQVVEVLLVCVGIFWVVSIGIVTPWWQRIYKKMFDNLVVGLGLGLFVLTGFALALVGLHNYNVWLLMTIALSCIALDSFAYFLGKWKGRHKLCPAISPGKTWEGLLGGQVVALCMSALVIVLLMQHSSEIVKSFFPWFILSVVAVCFAPFGDLVESVIKRVKGLEDSSTILPGHGGLLDRFDSYFAALPVSICTLGLLGI